MIEDKLTHDERLRLECVSQANLPMGPSKSAEQIIETAARLEDYIRYGKKDINETS